MVVHQEKRCRCEEVRLDLKVLKRRERQNRSLLILLAGVVGVLLWEMGASS